MRKIILSLIVIFLGFSANAQVKGILIDSASKKPIDNAVVALVVKANPTDTSYAFTDDKGQFRFDVVPTSPFSVIIRHMGYWPKAKYVPVSKAEKTIDVGSFILAQDAKLLSEVVVEAPAIVVKEDTIEYNASSFKVKEGALVEDLIKKMPGIQVDRDGNVTAQGKAVTRVKVNGKDFFGGDVKTATRELPANIVDKIQIIDDYGDQATVSGIKDGDPDKVMNIQIKKDKNKGFFGRVTGGYGTDDRYQGSFNGNYFNNNTQISVLGNSNNTNTSLFNFGGGGNRGATSMMRSGISAMSDMGGMGAMNNMMQQGGSGGSSPAFTGGSNAGISTTNSFGFNYRDQWSKRISVYGSYSYNHKNTDQVQNSYETNNTTLINNNQDLNSLTRGNSHRFTFNVEYQIDSFNYLKVSPSINYSGSDANSRTSFDYKRPDGTKTLDGSNKNLNGSEAPNLAATILYNHKFRKRGRNFSASITLGTSQNNSEQDVTNLSTQYQPFTFNRNTFQFTDQENNNYNYGVRFTYSEPINKFRSLDFSFSHNLNYGRNDRKTFNVDSATQVKTLNNFLSNDYENNFYNNRIGVSLRTTKKKYNYTLGISVQPVNLQGKSLTRDSAYKTIKRANVFPIARLVYNFSRTKTLNASYNGNASQPSFSQLQPVQDFTNPQATTVGNPNLKPSINHNLNLSYNNFNFVSGKVIFTNLTVSTIRNQIVNKTARRDSLGSVISIPENANGFYNVLGFYAYSKPFKNRKYVINFNGSLNFNRNISLTDSVRIIGNSLEQNLNRRKINGNNWIITQGFNFEYNYKDILELGTGVSYSLNDNTFKSADGNSLTGFQNTTSNAWTLSSNMNLNITKTLVLKYDFDYTINSGLASGVNGNLAIMNASLEKQLFKKKNGIIRLAAFDLFNQNSNISRNVSGPSIIDTRTNRLTRYFMATFTYRLQRFAGQTIQGPGMDIRRMGPPPKF
ncbi:MAG: outer membrane beta-barrel protein [Chitinophagaceae bacterium]|nr:outer membrane beta-barrel protein [Chitinophagaceae bacterium]